MDVASVEQLLAVLEKSRLLDSAQLAEARQLVQPGDDPRTAAKSLVHRQLITRWQAGQLLAGRSSFYLGKYRLIELIGHGGMGSVFLGQHVTMHRRVALKVISRELCHHRAALDRFLAEGRAVAALDHPNIVRAYSIDNEGDRYYLVMEYVDGDDFQCLVERDGPMRESLAADYIAQAADGLEHAHQQGLIHGDVKPSNLLVNRQGVVKILDLGLARLVGGASATEAKSNEPLFGSVDYLAPEQAIKSPAVDGRADIYSLGCTLYFLLIGHPPFSQGTLPERILKHQTQQPPDLRTLRPGISDEIASICCKMMSKKSENRFPTAAAVSQSLRQWLAGDVRRPPMPPLPKAKRLEEP
ncbi:MAG: serine/threonine-protein kinase [Thermoguttaceae bacterium]